MKLSATVIYVYKAQSRIQTVIDLVAKLNAIRNALEVGAADVTSLN